VVILLLIYFGKQKTTSVFYFPLCLIFCWHLLHTLYFLEVNFNFQISFQNTDMGRKLNSSGQCVFLSGRCPLIRQVVQKKFNCLDVRLHGPDAQAIYMEIVCISSTVGRHTSRSGRSKPWYGNCVQLKCNRPDARATPSGHSSIQEIISSKFGKPIAQLCVRTPSATIRTPPR